MNPKYTLRRCVGMVGIWCCLAGLVACQEPPSGPPVVPYGQALDVTQSGTFVEFDFRIDKPDRYDVVLEVFKKDNKERIPDEVWNTPNARFKVRLQSLSPTGWVLVDTEVSKAEERYGVLSEKSFGSSSTESTDLMSFTKFLVFQKPMDTGTYRVRVDNLNPMPALQGRLVKVSVERMHYAK